MKIERKNNEPSVTCLADINFGEVFILFSASYGDVYLKLDNPSIDYNCVNLTTAQVCWFDPQTGTIKKDATVVVS